MLMCWDHCHLHLFKVRGLSAGAEPGRVRVSPQPAAWSLEHDCLVHRDTGLLLTATRS